ESLLPVTEPTQPRQRNRQRGRTASTSVIIEPIDNGVREQSRPRIRGSSRGSNNNNNVVRDISIGSPRDPSVSNVDGFFLYSTPTRSTRQPTILTEPIENKPRRNQNSRPTNTRTTPGEVSIGNSYS